MNRPRTPGRRDLPRWFRARKRGGGFYLEHPITRECATLSADRTEALELYWALVPEIEAQVRAARVGRAAGKLAEVLEGKLKATGETLRAFLARWRTDVLPNTNKRGSTGALSPKTAGDYARMLRRQIEPLEATLIELTRIDAQSMRALLSPWLSMPHQYNYMRAVLTRALQHAVDEGVLSVNPMRSIDARAKTKRKAYITDADYVAITSKITEPYAVRACDLLYLLGMRPADCLGLRADALVKVDGRWCVNFAAGKTGVEQELVGNQALHDQLEWWRAWRAEHAPLSAYLLVHPRTAHRKICSRQIKVEWLSRTWTTATREAGHPEYTLRDIRPKSLTDEALAGNKGNKGGHLTQQMRDHYQRVRLPERSDVTIQLPKRTAK